MAETAGVLLALPGIADVVLRAATALWDRFETYQTMDEVMSSLRETTLNLKEGTLSRGLANLQHVQKAQTVPKSTHDELEKCLRKLQADLSATLQGLDKVQDTHMGRLRYTIWRGPGSKHQLEQQDQLLKRSCSQLQAYCDMLHELRTGPSCYLWTSDMFKVKHETVNEAKFTILPDSGIFVCQGNYATSSRREDGNFILENKSRENDVQMLCSLLNEDKLQELQGLLPVLGYRQPPYNEPDGTKVFQLIVPLPKDVSWESLEHRIVRSEKPALLQRLDICLKLAKAVEGIHTLELKHKSIRPRAVLLLGTPLDGDRAFKLYVQDWSFISKLSGATSLFGETNWQKSIYQHPERQGRYAEHAYDRKHDIYSLGVCILQVLLWQVFVQEATGAPDRICDLFETYALNRSGYSDSTGIPEKYRGNTQKITSKPWATQAIWREIAVGELDDVKLTRLVIRCLESDAAYAFREAKDVVKQLEVLLKQEQDGLNAPSYTTFGA